MPSNMAKIWSQNQINKTLSKQNVELEIIVINNYKWPSVPVGKDILEIKFTRKANGIILKSDLNKYTIRLIIDAIIF